MTKLTKLTASLTALAMFVAMSFMAFAPAKAQTSEEANESAATQQEENEATTTTQAPINSALANPISQWIVLTGLFNPYAYGAPVAGGAPGVGMYNPISQWIVLSGLFSPTALTGTTSTTTVDP